MSLVSPRPSLIEYLPLSLCSYELSRRHDIRPGISDYTQTNGSNSIG